MTTEFTAEHETAVNKLRERIRGSFEDFVKDTAKSLNKSAARRARKKSLEIALLLKKYRSFSIK